MNTTTQTVFILEGVRRQPTELKIKCAGLAGDYKSRQSQRQAKLKQLDAHSKAMFDRIHYVEMPEPLRKYLTEALLEQGQLIDELMEVN